MKRATLLLLLLALVACREEEKPQPLSERGETLYTLRGVILSRNATDNSLKVDHEPIPGFMEAMVMELPRARRGCCDIASREESDRGEATRDQPRLLDHRRETGSVNDERRSYQRLTLTEPLDGWFGDFTVRLVDVSASGAQIEHDEPIPQDARGLLRFYWRDQEVEILASTARPIHDNRTGLHFLEENDTLRALIATSAADLLRALEANARGDRGANVVGDETLTAAWQRPIAGYVSWVYDGGAWHARPSRKADQPANGFTISASEDDDQVELLRRTYESGDAEARRLTRMLAELSVLS